MRRRDGVAIGFVWVILVFGFLYGFADYPLLEPDEGRNAEVAREMAVTNDYVLPRLNGLPYLDKPVLFFAVAAASMEILGPSEFAARLPSLLFTLGTVVLVWGFGRRHFDADTALTAAVATAATPFALAYSRTVIFDSTLSFFAVAAILALYESIEARSLEDATWWRAGAWAATALGVLTKGPIALALPLLACIPYAIVRRRLGRVFDPLSGLLFLALVLPWVFAIAQKIPNFVNYVVVTETLSRLSSNELGRAEPWWYFIAIMPAAALPWSLVALGNARRLATKMKGAERHHVQFCLSWLVVPLIFFSLSTTKRPQYVLPLIPAVAFLCAVAWRRRESFKEARVVGIALGFIGLSFMMMHDHIAGWVSASDLVAVTIPSTAVTLGAVCLLAATLVTAGIRSRGIVMLGLSLPIAAIPIVGADLMSAIGRDRSARELASAIDELAGPEAQVVTIESFPTSLPFYLRRPVVVATDDGSELTSNYLLRHFDAWKDEPTIRPASWWRDALLECRRPRVFVTSVRDESARRELAAALPTIAVTRKYVAYGPCGVSGLASGG